MSPSIATRDRCANSSRSRSASRASRRRPERSVSARSTSSRSPSRSGRVSTPTDIRLPSARTANCSPSRSPACRTTSMCSPCSPPAVYPRRRSAGALAKITMRSAPSNARPNGVASSRARASASGSVRARCEGFGRRKARGQMQQAQERHHRARCRFQRVGLFDGFWRVAANQRGIPPLTAGMTIKGVRVAFPHYARPTPERSSWSRVATDGRGRDAVFLQSSVACRFFVPY